jgi:branched-chain amino acid transport system ATP-binding protein
MLDVYDVQAFYGDVQVLKGITLHVGKGELVAVIGANGAGKTTLLNTVSGVLKPRGGKITFDGTPIGGMAAHRIVGMGLVQVPEGRLLFPFMTARENLEMGAYLLPGDQVLEERLESVYGLFPILREREKQIAGTLSGGEQQMLAIGRALMTSPRMIMFDEPSLGLAPKLVQNVIEQVVFINKSLGVSILLVEQNVRQSCLISDRAYVLENGGIVLEGTGAELLNSEHVRRAYLGL